MSEFAEKIADAVEVALGDDGHCIVYKRQAVVAAIEAARQSAGQERGEAVAWIRTRLSNGERDFDEEGPSSRHAALFSYDPLYAAPTDAQSRIAELEAQLAAKSTALVDAMTYTDQLHQRIAVLEEQLKLIRTTAARCKEMADIFAKELAEESEKLTESREREGRMREALGLVIDLASKEWQESDGSRKGATDNQGRRLWFISPDVMQAVVAALAAEKGN